jgi:hypothetical protein
VGVEVRPKSIPLNARLMILHNPMPPRWITGADLADLEPQKILKDKHMSRGWRGAKRGRGSNAGVRLQCPYSRERPNPQAHSLCTLISDSMGY